MISKKINYYKDHNKNINKVGIMLRITIIMLRKCHKLKQMLWF